MATSLARENTAVQASVDNSALARIRQSLPTLEQFGGSLRYGSAVVVSSQGPEVITLIRAVPMRQGKERNAVLTKLWRFSGQGIPEAPNFSDFVYEYGLFGAQRDLRRAWDYYVAAAAHRYQPALLNLATMAYFGKDRPSDLEAARELIYQAVGVGPESSGRVCGLASFIEYRRGDPEAALRFGRSCYSALAHIPNAAYDTKLPLAHRIKLLRDSIGTGAPDGYRWLETLTRDASPDPSYLYCKYRLINQVRAHPGRADLDTLARSCYAARSTAADGKTAEATVKGIVSFVLTEQRALERLRQTDRFHHVWSVPYLPFGQGDIDLFAAVMKDTK